MTGRAIEVERLNRANELLRVIASCGRQFFEYKGEVSEFAMRSDGTIWFRDHYTRKWLYTHRPHMPRGFTNGGTLNDFVIRLRKYIKNGVPLKVPIPQHWAYGDDIQKVLDKADELNAVLEAVPA